MTDPEHKFETTAEEDNAFATYARAKEWQQIFDNLTNPSEAEDLIDQATVELDTMFPYKGRSVYIAGYGLHSDIDKETGQQIGDTWEYRTGTEGQHNGFMVIEADEDGNTTSYRVMQQIFIGGLAGMVKLTVHQKLMYFDYFDLDSSCVVVDEVNGIFYEATKPIMLTDQKDAVQKASQTLDSLLQSATFRLMDHDKQCSQVSEIIDQAEREVKIRGSELLAEAEYGYVNEVNVDMYITPIDIRNSVVGGICLGLESMESLALRAHAIRQDADLIDKTAGICLVIDPNDETRQGLDLKPKQLLYVPVGQNLELEKISEAIIREATD